MCLHVSFCEVGRNQPSFFILPLLKVLQFHKHSQNKQTNKQAKAIEQMQELHLKSDKGPEFQAWLPVFNEV